MAKQCMARPDRTHTTKNEMQHVPEIQGEAKSGKKDASPFISGTSGLSQNVSNPERPISKSYKELDTDLARDNMENDLPDADLQDL